MSVPGALLDAAPVELRLGPAEQQPRWADDAEPARVRAELTGRPALVDGTDVRRLQELLAEVAAGELTVVQAGDCAEDPAESTVGHVARKAGLLDALAGTMVTATRRPVLRVGRIAGQYAKPRSLPTERVDGRTLPVFRGHMVNRPEPDARLRRHDPRLLLSGYEAAAAVFEHLGWGGWSRPEPAIWTSHEALLLDYELPLLRREPDGGLLLGSTHWPWVGVRTQRPGGAHVDLLAAVRNPVACKVGPNTSRATLRALCDRLDPHRRPGRLTLIARLGPALRRELPGLVATVRAAGHPVIWLCDPMHANTVTGPDGRKTRFLDAIVREIRQFQEVVPAAGGVAGGLHLETTPEDVDECLAGRDWVGGPAAHYTSHCDPRLNPAQALDAVSAWTG